MIGTVYKIEIGEKIYIGSTIQKLYKRQTKHNEDYRKRNNKLYQECRKHNVEKIICIPLEVKEIENDLEIRLLEQEYIDELNPLLNQKSTPSGLPRLEQRKQYREKNKEKIREMKKKYYKNNKEKESIKRKQDWIKNREHYIEQQKQYCENNKERIKENNKKYYQNNKEELNDKKKVDITCPICGFVGRKDKLNRHQRTKKCLELKELVDKEAS